MQCDYKALARDLDALKARTFLQLGADDVAHVTRMRRLSRGSEVIGRLLLHVSLDPATFTAGVLALWLHKQLEATEIGHTALHGAYDRLPGAEAFRSDDFAWDVPIDEPSWKKGHNLGHHGNTNIAGKDPDIDFGQIRLTEQTPYAPYHAYQMWITAAAFLNFGAAMNLHFTELDKGFNRERVGNALRKFVPYYAKNFVFYPALAGPLWWKVLLGNWMAETLRDVYSAATIFCGHVGADVASWPEGTKASSRGQWYAMQIEAANNFEVPRPISILCGGLDRQIEHHLFPTLPPERLRQIAPEVKRICEKHGLPYKTDTWGRTLGKALRHIKRLARDRGPAALQREAA